MDAQPWPVTCVTVLIAQITPALTLRSIWPAGPGSREGRGCACPGLAVLDPQSPEQGQIDSVYVV